MTNKLTTLARLIIGTGICCLSLSLEGCISPITLHRAVLQYDRTVTQIENELLLLNIARVRNNDSIHFSGISSIIATFNFSVTGGWSGFWVQNPGLTSSSLGGNLSMTASESPTITISPIQGEEFTKRLLTPMGESKLEFLAHQGIDLGIILRLMGSEIAIRGQGHSGYAINSPENPVQYEEFRRRVLHMASLRQNNNLYIGPIRYTNGNNEEVIGRVTITNFEMSQVSNDYRRELQEEARILPRNQVLLVIGQGFPGGDYPLYGRIKLRNFKEILSFIGRTMGEQHEYQVEKDLRTRKVPVNPDRTIAIREDKSHPGFGKVAVEHKDFWYSIDESSEDPLVRQWNNQAFDVLYQLFQMTVTDVSRAQSPMITIAK